MKKTLVVGPSWVGDMVMAQGLFKVIKKEADPGEISVLAPPWSEPILERMPEVDRSIEMPIGHGVLHLGLRRKIARSIRRYHFDQAIILPGSLKSALIPWLAGIPRRTGFVGEQRWGLLNDIRKLDRKRMPMNIQRYVFLGLDKDHPVIGELPRPSLQVDENALEATLNRFKLDLNQPVVAFCPGAEYGPAKRWPPRYFAEVARKKISQGWQVWLFGSENDRKTTEEINALSEGGCIDLAGRTSLGEVVDLMSVVKYVVTNDSGLMHIGAATGSHVIAIYGSSGMEFTPPLTDKCSILSLGLSCSPCFKRECPLQHMNCLNQLSPDRVLDCIGQPG